MEIVRQYVIPFALKALPVVGLIVGGLLLSWIAGRVVRWLVRKTGLEALAEKAGVAKLLYAVGVQRGLAHFLGKLTFLCGLVVTLSALAEHFGLPGIAAATSTLVGFAPKLLAAAAILVGGMLIGDVLRKLVGGVARRREDLDSPDVVGSAIYYGVLTLAVIMAVDQIGFKTSLIDSLVQMAVGILLFSLGLGFALGSRQVFNNFLARQYYQPLVRIGDRITVGEHSGVVVRYGRLAVVIRADDGTECIVPCTKLLEDCVPLDRNPAPAGREKPAE